LLSTACPEAELPELAEQTHHHGSQGDNYSHPLPTLPPYRLHIGHLFIYNVLLCCRRADEYATWQKRINVGGFAE